MPRFTLSSNGSYTKILQIGDVKYKITIPADIWKTYTIRKITQHTHYWARNIKMNKTPFFKYGTVEICDTSVIHMCDECDKVYNSRSGLLRHIRAKHSSVDNISTEPPQATLVTNNTTINNIQNNITIRPFGKENPKWITEKVILDALRNIPGAIMNLVKEKHFNDRFPENRNVEICNEFRNRYVSVQEEDRRRIDDKKNIFMKMCTNACDAVTTTLESYTEPADSDTSENEGETPEDKRCRLVASRIRKSTHFSSVVDRYIDKWQDYVSNVEQDEVLKHADHYITMLLLDLKLALAHEEEMRNEREVMG